MISLRRNGLCAAFRQVNGEAFRVATPDRIAAAPFRPRQIAAVTLPFALDDKVEQAIEVGFGTDRQPDPELHLRDLVIRARVTSSLRCIVASQPIIAARNSETPQMNDTARLYQYKAMFESRRLVTRDDLRAVAEVSLATFKRDIAKLRDQLGMPIVFDRDRGAYYLDRSDVRTELPGLWFSPEELVALLTIQRLIEQLQPGLVGLKLKPLQKKLTDLLRAKGFGEPEIASRVRMMFAGKRELALKAFQAVALATIARRQIAIHHFNRQSGAFTHRTVSPQQLVHYRDNWYLDAWCHLRQGVRSFSIDVIEGVEMLPDAALEVDPDELRRITQSSYGIFAGQPTDWAVLRFSAQRARWIEGEIWHSEQRATYESDGSYLLKLPYADDRELMGDILRHGADVQVLEPPALRTKVQKVLLEAASRYL